MLLDQIEVEPIFVPVKVDICPVPEVILEQISEDKYALCPVSAVLIYTVAPFICMLEVGTGVLVALPTNVSYCVRDEPVI